MLCIRLLQRLPVVLFRCSKWWRTGVSKSRRSLDSGSEGWVGAEGLQDLGPACFTGAISRVILIDRFSPRLEVMASKPGARSSIQTAGANAARHQYGFHGCGQVGLAYDEGLVQQWPVQFQFVSRRSRRLHETLALGS